MLRQPHLYRLPAAAVLLATALLLHTPPAAAYSGGTGILGDPYLISNVADLQQLSATSTDWDKHFLMTADVDMVGVTGFTPIGDGTTRFTGVFDGGGYAVQNLTIDLPGQDIVGFFGYLDGSGGPGTGVIRDLCVEAVDITAGSNVGGLAGYARAGTATGCYATGTVTGANSVGGLVGYITGSVLTSCYATGVVTGNQNVGGLVGENNSGGAVTGCYATSEVTGNLCVGGLVGENDNGGTLTGCYATGAVTGNSRVGGLVGDNGNNTVTGCFWDIETSGQAGSSAGKGVTTAHMQMISTFANGGWQGQGWVMNEGEYPRLAWEGTGAPPIPAAEPIPLAGSGTELDPYIVMTPAQFAALSSHIDYLSAHIQLGASIDCAAETLFPIGSLGAFSGTFDGGGHTISNLTIEQPGGWYVGAFSQLTSTGEIRDIGLLDIAVEGRNYVGGLLGFNNGGIVTGCFSTGDVSSDGYYVGGLIGNNYVGSITGCHSECVVVGGYAIWNWLGGLLGNNDAGTVSNCYATGDVWGGEVTGGLIGNNENGASVSGCYATGNVTCTKPGGYSAAGGLIGGAGNNGGCTVTDCYATGNVVATGHNVGGLCGGTYSATIINCFATGSVSGEYNVGGLVGDNDNQGGGPITDCYATGPVTADYNAGGLVGINSQPVTNCYATGTVTAGSALGGLVGTGSGAVNASFWDTTTGGPDNGYGTGLPTAQMQQRATFEGAGWDFADDDGDDPDWIIYEGVSYPFFYGAPIPIASLSDLEILELASDGEFFLTRDINAIETRDWALKSGLPGFSPLCSLASPFVGTLNGNGHRIFGLHINRPSMNQVGLFAAIGATGVVREVGLDQLTVTGGTQVGGLAGVNDGTVDRCYVQGDVAGASTVGGLIGENRATGSVSESYAATTLSGSNTGGLIGASNGGTATNSFWDTTTSGTLVSGGGTGLATPWMQYAPTFNTAGWDMTTTWELMNQVSYPYFRNSASARVVTGPPRLIDADYVDISVQAFVPGLFVTIGGGAYPAYHKFEAAGTATIRVGLKQEAINELTVSLLSTLGIEAVVAEYEVFESAMFPATPTAVTALTLSPSSVALAADDTVQFMCAATFADGTVADVTPTMKWNLGAADGEITTRGFYRHGTNPQTVQALLRMPTGWQYSNIATVTTLKSLPEKAGTGYVQGAVYSNHTLMPLVDARVTAYEVANPAAHDFCLMYDANANYSLQLPEDKYHFEGACTGYRSQIHMSRLLHEGRFDPGPPRTWAPAEYSGQIRSGMIKQIDYPLLPVDPNPPWVAFIEPAADITVAEEDLTVTAIATDEYSPLSVATFTLNTQDYDVLDAISSTGFYRNTWKLQVGLNDLKLHLVDNAGKQNELTIRVIYDPNYELPDVDSDGDGMPDWWETQYGLSPGSAAGDDGAFGDLDGDGLTNRLEFYLDSLPNSKHSDGDTLEDGDEYRFGTNLLLEDTDGDGLNDDVEWAMGGDPTHDDRIRMAVTSPAPGLTVRGNAVTLLAETLDDGNADKVVAVSFELRGPGTGGTWQGVGTVFAAPFAVVWDADSYALGVYDVRAAATSTLGCVDNAALATQLEVSASGAHHERVETGTHIVSTPVLAAEDNVVALRDGAQFARITLPAGALPADDVVTAFFPDPAGLSPLLVSNQRNADLYLDIALDSAVTNLEAGYTAGVTLSYPDADQDDRVDGSELRAPLLWLGYLPGAGARYERLVASTCDGTAHCVTGTTDHFSTFGLVEEQPAQPLHITTIALPGGVQGFAYDAQLEAEGGIAPLTWTLAGGSFPGDLLLESNGHITGTQGTPGEFVFTVQLSDDQDPPLTAEHEFAIYIAEATAPTVTVTRAATQPQLDDALPVAWDIVFSEAVTGFSEAGVVLEGTAANGASYSVSGGPAAYTFEVDGLLQGGSLRPTVPPGAALFGVVPSRPSLNEEDVFIDLTDPQVQITCVYPGLQDPGATGPIVFGMLPVVFQIQFTEPVNGFDETGVSFAEGAFACTVSGGGAMYTLVLDSLASATTVTPTVLGGSATDAVGRGNIEKTYDGREAQFDPESRPTVTLERRATQADPANALPVYFDIAFSESVTGFETADVTFVGSATNPQYAVTGSGAAYALEVTGADSDGLLAFTIGEDVVTGGNAASTSLDNSVYLDRQAPTLTVGAPSVDITDNGPVSFTVNYAGAKTIGLQASDITLNGTPTAQVAVSGQGDQMRLVTLAEIDGTGDLSISIAADTAQDAAGNQAAAAGPSTAFQVGDLTPPTVTVEQAAGQADPTNTTPVLFDVEFSEDVTGFVTGDVVMGGTATGVVFDVTGFADSYTITVTAVGGEGTLEPAVPAACCEDAAGNANEGSTSVDNSVFFDLTPPGFTNIAAAPSPAGEGAQVTITCTADEPLAVQPAATVNGNAATFVNGAGLDYSFTYTVQSSDADGAATIAISGVDIAGNPGTTQNTTALTIDHTQPTADFTAAPLAGMPPLAVQFTDASTPVSGTPITDWQWDYGDGSGPGGGASPLYTYTAAGVYDVTLTITDDAVNTDAETKTSYIIIGGPTAGFTANATTGYAPVTIQFTDASDQGSSAITDWLWDFGDGAISTEQNPAHTYADAGGYTVSLTVTTAITSDAKTETGYLAIAPGVAPVAAFTGDVVQGTAPLEVHFTDQTNPGTHAITAWYWDFGDGATSDQQNPLHTFQEQGSYTISLTVTTDAGAHTHTQHAYITADTPVPLSATTLALLAAALAALAAAILLRRRTRAT